MHKPLPVQCLDEFLLRETQDTHSEPLDDESAKFEKHKKRLVRIFELQCEKLEIADLSRRGIVLSKT